MMNGKMPEQCPREKIVSEIAALKEMIKRFNEGKIGHISNFNYAESLRRLQYLRNRLRMLGRDKQKLRGSRVETDS